jgi:hypothetical protein
LLQALATSVFAGVSFWRRFESCHARMSFLLSCIHKALHTKKALKNRRGDRHEVLPLRVLVSTARRCGTSCDRKELVKREDFEI